MKQYLKMADVFKKEVLVEKSIAYTLKNEIDRFYRVREVNDDTLMCSGGDVASYAAHAINSHDELVQMNQELMAALEGMLQWVAYAPPGDLSYLERAHAAIKKVKGGAA